jgi:hypothetical protein
MKNISRFYISCIKKKRITGRISHSAGRSTIFKHFKRTEQYANTICFSLTGICGLAMNVGRQRGGGNIRKWYLYSEYASYILLPIVCYVNIHQLLSAEHNYFIY